MAKKSIWLDRGLVFGPYFCLCLSEKSFHRELKKFGVGKKDRPDFLSGPYADATCHHFQHEAKRASACIVCLRDWQSKALPCVLGLLIHEGTHVWQSALQNMEEKDPSPEFEAYAIQNICQELIDSFFAQTKIKVKIK